MQVGQLDLILATMKHFTLSEARQRAVLDAMTTMIRAVPDMAATVIVIETRQFCRIQENRPVAGTHAIKHKGAFKYRLVCDCPVAVRPRPFRRPIPDEGKP